jgi:uncharacterized membrane protein
VAPHPDRSPADQKRRPAGNANHPAVERAASFADRPAGHSGHVDGTLGHRLGVVPLSVAVDDDEGNRGVPATVERQRAAIVCVEVRAEPGAKPFVEFDQGRIRCASISFHRAIRLTWAPGDSGIAPLLVGRAVSSAILIAAVVALRRRLGEARPNLPAAAGAGALDSLANLSFLLAVREGELAVVAVITALYPAATVILARAFLAERIGAIQLAGLGLAALAVSLLAAG